ncbi:LysR family transcriptional regulator [Piscinibacter sakaiensis]|uniref:Putative transcription regulator protein n=1 Tax=Piscinibacter sakaiensis TaxID=1547922 RepID=A0A0K8P0E8_PISS1|nr:LysR family transcriptional regulator [Piscinibacter sakaiensis]GAP36019.1 putative transcription regulator protein [Piscinibacter sakaiensis]
MAPARRTVDYRIDPFDLHLFAAVVEHRTITAAAAAVNLSLPAASARLKALEEVAGTRLLQRSKAGATPTDAGRALARHAHRVLAELEALHVDMASFGHGLRGTLRLLCNTAAMSEALPGRIGRFLSTTPDLDIEVRELPSEEVIDALRRGTADLGIVADHIDPAGLLVKPWIEDRLVAVLPSRHALARRRHLSYGELLEEPLVGLPRDSGLSRFLAGQASRSGRVPRHRVRLGGFDAVARLVAAGAGVAVMPERAAVRCRDAGTRVVPLSDAWATRRLLICITPQGWELNTVRTLVDALLQPPPGA